LGMLTMAAIMIWVRLWKHALLYRG
jgi:hypothetical protein